jgi:hypothetical protein
MPTYYLSDADLTALQYETLSLSAPASLDEAQGWTVNKKSSPNYCAYKPDTTRPASDFVSNEPSAFSQLGYRTSGAKNGTFAPGAWQLAFKVKCNSYYSQTGYVKFRLWRSTNANGAGATQITAGWQTSGLISFTAANQYKTGTVSVSLSTVTLTNEYLFLEIEWSVQASGGNNTAAVYWCHHEGAAEKLTTPAFNVGLAGISPGAGAIIGAAKLARKIAGNTTAAAGVAGAVKRVGKIAGNALGAAAAAAPLHRIKRLQASACAANSLTAGVARVSRRLYGTISASAGAGATLKDIRKIRGTIAPLATAGGGLARGRKIAGGSAARGEVGGRAGLVRLVAGFSGALSALAGPGKVLRRITGAALGLGAISGPLIIRGRLQGTASGDAAVSGAVKARRRITGVGDATSFAAASLQAFSGGRGQYEPLELQVYTSRSEVLAAMSQRGVAAAASKSGVAAGTCPLNISAFREELEINLS